MRRSILAFVIAAIVVVVAQPAVAVDDGFRGRYRLIVRQIHGGCGPLKSYRREVHVRFVDERVREFARPDAKSAMDFSYDKGKAYPWQHWHWHGSVERGIVLRYDPATDSAEGLKYAPQCAWTVRLIPIG